MVGNIYITGGANWQTTDVNTSTAEEIFTLNNVGIGTDNPQLLDVLEHQMTGGIIVRNTNNSQANARASSRNKWWR